jgi:tight adherence protein B
LTDPTLIAVLLIPLLLGGALGVVLLRSRGRQVLQLRLKDLAAVEPAESVPEFRLRRPRREVGSSASFLGAMRVRLHAELLATGNRIGIFHLALSGVIAAGAVFVFTIGLLRLNPSLAIVLSGVACFAAAILVLRVAQRRYQSKFLEVFPDALDLIGRAVKAGLPVLDAMEVAAQSIPAPVGSEFKGILEEVRIGVEIEQALRHAAERVRVPEFHFYVVTLALQNRTGGSLAETLANLSNIIRRRKELRLKIRAFVAESKMSVIVLSALPFGAAGLLSLVAQDLMAPLVTDPRGRFMIGLALISLLTGTAVMTYMVKRSMR